MATAYKEGPGPGSNQQLHGSASASSYGSNSVHGEWGVPTFQHQQTISMDWTPEEQTVLEEGLAKYASESNIIRYAKISVQLKNKTVRDVALRCRWMTKKEINKRRKDDFNARKIKDRRDKVVDSMPKPCIYSGSGLSHFLGTMSNTSEEGMSYNNGITTGQLLQHNAWTLEQISANLVTHQIRENISLLSQARDNIFQLLAKLNDMEPATKKMPPLPKVNEELARSILPPSIH